MVSTFVVKSCLWGLSKTAKKKLLPNTYYVCAIKYIVMKSFFNEHSNFLAPVYIWDISWIFVLSLKNASTVNSRFKKDLKLQIHLHKAFFSDDRFLDSLHKSSLNQTTLDLRKKKMDFLKPRVYCIRKFKSDPLLIHLNCTNRNKIQRTKKKLRKRYLC